MKMEPGFLARSLAGNDKGQIYRIIEDAGAYVFLLDQDDKRLQKNKKHVQVIKKRR